VDDDLGVVGREPPRGGDAEHRFQLDSRVQVSSLSRGLITGAATFLGGSVHALPFLIGDVHTALAIAYAVVAVELCAIAWVRKRYLKVSLTGSLVQVTAGGAVVAVVGVLVGQA
jgi:VIT1/CCC1 family predicted Fe2+/Mn2+ transporter